jgi:hypothetical protein
MSAKKKSPRGNPKAIEQPEIITAPNRLLEEDETVILVLDSTGSVIKGLSPVALRLLDAAAEMQQSPDAYERAFLARQLIQCTFPHKDPGNIPIWSRTNGNLTLSIRPIYDKIAKEHKYPYGTLPRLFLHWLVTEAVRTKSRRLYLGKSYADFMRKLGLDPGSDGGGKRSAAKKLREQIERMLRATISFEQTQKRGKNKGESWVDMQIGPEAVLWWDSVADSQDSLFESYIELSEKFFAAIVSSPVPLDLRALRALRKSPLALDLYSLIVHKTYSAKMDDSTKTIPWQGLHLQMGAEYKMLNNFRQKVTQTVKKIRLVYPAMKVDFSDAGMHIHPAPLAIPATFDGTQTEQKQIEGGASKRLRRPRR